MLPARGLAEHLGVEGDNYQRWLLREQPHGRAARLFAEGAVDETAAAVNGEPLKRPVVSNSVHSVGNKIL